MKRAILFAIVALYGCNAITGINGYQVATESRGDTAPSELDASADAGDVVHNDSMRDVEVLDDTIPKIDGTTDSDSAAADSAESGADVDSAKDTPLDCGAKGVLCFKDEECCSGICNIPSCW